jgi:hypothetical protein
MPDAALATSAASRPEAFHFLSEPVASADILPLPKKRGPKTEAGKARSRMNAMKHGLRARVLPMPLREDVAGFEELAAGLRRTYRPKDEAELALAEAIAVAMWQAIRADRLEAETLDAIAATADGGTLGEALVAAPGCRVSLGTVIRYQAGASNAVRRAMDMLFKHRRARRDGLIATAEACTNDFPERAAPVEPEPQPSRTAGAARPGPASPAFGPLPMPFCLLFKGDARGSPAPAAPCTNDFVPRSAANGGSTPRPIDVPPFPSRREDANVVRGAGAGNRQTASPVRPSRG